MLSPRSAAEAALAETLSAIGRIDDRMQALPPHISAATEPIRQMIQALPEQLREATTPIAERMEKCVQGNEFIAQRIEKAAVSINSVAGQIGKLKAIEVSAAQEGNEPTQIPGRTERARRYTLSELLLAGLVGAVVGGLCAAALGIHIPGLTS